MAMVNNPLAPYYNNSPFYHFQNPLSMSSDILDDDFQLKSLTPQEVSKLRLVKIDLDETLKKIKQGRS